MKTENELLEKLEEKYDYAALKDFKDRYIEVEPGICTKKFVDFLMNLINEEWKSKRKNIEG